MPTLTRQLINAPSREKVFDALRLHAEGRLLTFDVARPESQPIPRAGWGTEMTEEERLERVLCARAYFPARITDISASGGDDWIVKGVLFENSWPGSRTIELEAHLNTRERCESGNLVVSWTTEGEARSA